MKRGSIPFRSPWRPRLLLALQDRCWCWPWLFLPPTPRSAQLPSALIRGVPLREPTLMLTRGFNRITGRRGGGSWLGSKRAQRAGLMWERVVCVGDRGEGDVQMSGKRMSDGRRLNRGVKGRNRVHQKKWGEREGGWRGNGLGACEEDVGWRKREKRVRAGLVRQDKSPKLRREQQFFIYIHHKSSHPFHPVVGGFLSRFILGSSAWSWTREICVSPFLWVGRCHAAFRIALVLPPSFRRQWKPEDSHRSEALRSEAIFFSGNTNRITTSRATENIDVFSNCYIGAIRYQVWHLKSHFAALELHSKLRDGFDPEESCRLHYSFTALVTRLPTGLQK